jgi:hypothetical protein
MPRPALGRRLADLIAEQRRPAPALGRLFGKDPTMDEKTLKQALKNLESGLRFAAFPDPDNPVFGWVVIRTPWLPGVHAPEASSGLRAGYRALKWAAAQLRGAGLVRELREECPGSGRDYDPAIGRCNQCGTVTGPDAGGQVPPHDVDAGGFEIDLAEIARRDAETADHRDDLWETADPVREAFDTRQKLAQAIKLLRQLLAPPTGKQGRQKLAALRQEARTFVAHPSQPQGDIWALTADLWLEAWELMGRLAHAPHRQDQIRAWRDSARTVLLEAYPFIELDEPKPDTLHGREDLEGAVKRTRELTEEALREALAELPKHTALAQKIRFVLGG